MTDLFVLTADKNTKGALEALLARQVALRIRPITFDIYALPGNDPAVLRQAHDYCRSFLKTHGFALIVFDRDGCGSSDTAQVLADKVQERLNQNGWRDRSAVIVLDPELEIWVWADSPHVARALRWPTLRGLRTWLEGRGLWGPEEQKPIRPKEAMEAALRQAREPRSTAIYVKIARAVDFSECQDPSFLSFRTTLTSWFPPH